MASQTQWCRVTPLWTNSISLLPYLSHKVQHSRYKYTYLTSPAHVKELFGSSNWCHPFFTQHPAGQSSGLEGCGSASLLFQPPYDHSPAHSLSGIVCLTGWESPVPFRIAGFCESFLSCVSIPKKGIAGVTPQRVLGGLCLRGCHEQQGAWRASTSKGWLIQSYHPLDFKYEICIKYSQCNYSPWYVFCWSKAEGQHLAGFGLQFKQNSLLSDLGSHRHPQVTVWYQTAGASPLSAQLTDSLLLLSTESYVHMLLLGLILCGIYRISPPFSFSLSFFNRKCPKNNRGRRQKQNLGHFTSDTSSRMV